MKKVLFIMLALLSMQFMYAQQTNIDVDKENIEESILQANAANGIVATISGPINVTLNGGYAQEEYHLEYSPLIPGARLEWSIRAPQAYITPWLICNPNNPTGYLYTRREMNQIRDLVKEHDLYLFSDEVYREYIYTGSPYISAMHLKGIEDNVILIDSVSKRYSECGIRIGALITKNEEVKKAVMKFCQARLSPPLIGQIVAEASLDAPEEYYRDVYDEYVERRKCLIDGLNRIPGVYSPIPMGAFYTVAQLPVDDADKFCKWCLEEFNYEGETVMMAPAAGFYTTPGAGVDQVRIAYVLKKDDLERALFILRKALEAYPGRK